MRQFLLAAAIASLIATPVAFAKSAKSAHHSSHHAVAKAGKHKASRYTITNDSAMAQDKQLLQAQRSTGYVDEEEIGQDELALQPASMQSGVAMQAN